MATIPFQKRTCDLFVSYGHADGQLIDPIVAWLRRAAGLEIWYDATSGDASQRSSELLAGAIRKAKGCLFFLSPNWQDSSWCKDEHEFALTEKRSNDSFALLAVRIVDMDIPSWFQTANVLDFREFNARSAAQLLRSIAPERASRLDNQQDVYFAGPWSRPSKVATSALRVVAEMGWRLVGDSPDNPHFTDSEGRITSIIDTCRGLVAVLPFDESCPPSYTRQYIVDEVVIARNRRRPFLLLAEEKVEVPPELGAASFGGTALRLSADGTNAPVRDWLDRFDEELSHRPHSDRHAYSFLATSLLGDPGEIEDLVAVIERATNIPCILGHRLKGQHVQQAIVDRIRGAAFCISDVTNDSKNSLIEAGIALGAETPLHLLSQPPSDGSLKTRFMFQDIEMNWYRNPIERLGAAYRIARPYRRRVLSPK